MHPRDRSTCLAVAIRKALATASGVVIGTLAGLSSTLANPDGAQVVAGSATIEQTDPKRVDIQQHTDKAIINWQGFSIQQDEHTNFQQPSPSSIALNRVTGGNPTEIHGRLSANGNVWLINQNGILFGEDAKVDVNGLMATTADIKNEDFMAGRYTFTQAPGKNTAVVNQGTITAKEGGLVALVAPGVENSGVIEARLGKVQLSSGTSYTVDLYGDGKFNIATNGKVTDQITGPDGKPLTAAVANSGKIIADGGTVLMTADAAKFVVDNAINMEGYVQAKSVSVDQTGTIALLGGDEGNVRIAGTLDTSASPSSASAGEQTTPPLPHQWERAGVRATGGEIRVVAADKLTVEKDAKILAEGSEQGGDGGFVALAGGTEANIDGKVSVKSKVPDSDNGWLYKGTNTKAATTMRNPNKSGMGQAADSPALPIYFEENRGQTDEHVKFVGRDSGSTLFLTPAEAVLALQGKEEGSFTSLALLFGGANTAPEVVGEDLQPGISNYYIGNDPTQWVEGVPHYAKVRYKNIYDGVDLVYYGNKQGDLEYDLVVNPGADPSNIVLDYSGADSITKTGSGDLSIGIGDDEIVQKAPLAYQLTDDARMIVPAEYRVDNTGKTNIELDPYDAKRPLVVDPVLVYSTYIGGSVEEELGALTFDSRGSAYVAGRTFSPNFPTGPGAYPASRGGPSDGFVVKLDAAGGPVYSTYLGGTAQDAGVALKVDDAGNAYLAGWTFSSNLPATSGVFQQVHGGELDGFLAKLNSTGALVYSTYLGGTAHDEAVALTVDGAGAAYVAGNTRSADISTTAGAFGGDRDGFLVKVGPTGAPLYSTYLGGTAEDGVVALTVDDTGNAYIAGNTGSSDFPLPGAFQPAHGGGADAFLIKFDAIGIPVYSNFLGGTGLDVAVALAVDSVGNAYIAGETQSSNFPTRSGAFQLAYGGIQDAFLVKLDAVGAPVYSTYLGGGNNDVAEMLAVDNAGSAYVAGGTYSSDFPIRSAIQPYGGGADAFLVKLDAVGAPVYSTFVGGMAFDWARAGTVDAAGNVYLWGDTESSNFHTTGGAIQPTLGGGQDAFLVKLDAVGARAYSTYVGSPHLDWARRLAVDDTGNAYLAGGTVSSDFPATSTALFQPVYGGGFSDAFLVNLDLSAFGTPLPNSNPNPGPNPSPSPTPTPTPGPGTGGTNTGGNNTGGATTQTTLPTSNTQSQTALTQVQSSTSTPSLPSPPNLLSVQLR